MEVIEGNQPINTTLSMDPAKRMMKYIELPASSLTTAISTGKPGANTLPINAPSVARVIYSNHLSSVCTGGFNTRSQECLFLPMKVLLAHRQKLA